MIDREKLEGYLAVGAMIVLLGTLFIAIPLLVSFSHWISEVDRCEKFSESYGVVCDPNGFWDSMDEDPAVWYYSVDGTPIHGEDFELLALAFQVQVES